ncbi:MAG: TRAM domain-containing protein [Myxococcales bacterium]|nr:TRAM domain-containing protein [Myxococcales bacterium]
MKKGEELVIRTASGLSAEGAAVGRVADGRVVFVRGAAPEETARIRLTHVTKRFLRADLAEVLHPSASRVIPPCEHIVDCGGCSLMHIESDLVRDVKVSEGLNTLRRLGGVPEEVGLRKPVQALDLTGYRTRARLAVGSGGVGYRRAYSHELVPIQHCLVLHPRLNETRNLLERLIEQLSTGHPVSGEVRLITNGRELSIHLPESLLFLMPALGEISWVKRNEPVIRADRWGSIFLSASVFSQASLQGNDALLAELEQLLPQQGELALELYAGSGNFTRLLAQRFTAVVAVELERPAVELGRKLGLSNVEWVCAPSSAKHLRDRWPSWVVVNPPRTGIESGVLADLAKLRPAQVVYISCHVGSLARDLRQLQAAGFRVQTLAAFDIYPATPHLEWVASLALDMNAD